VAPVALPHAVDVSSPTDRLDANQPLLGIDLINNPVLTKMSRVLSRISAGQFTADP
jgi:hypothetical protein